MERTLVQPCGAYRVSAGPHSILPFPEASAILDLGPLPLSLKPVTLYLSCPCAVPSLSLKDLTEDQSDGIGPAQGAHS